MMDVDLSCDYLVKGHHLSTFQMNVHNIRSIGIILRNMADRNDDPVLGSLSDMIVDSVEAVMDVSFVPLCGGRDE